MRLSAAGSSAAASWSPYPSCCTLLGLRPGWQIGIKPDLTGIATVVRAFIFDRTASVDGFVSDFVTGPVLVVLDFLPVATSVFHVSGSKEGIHSSFSHGVRGHLHVDVLLWHQN